MGGIGVICFSVVEGNTLFDIISTMQQILQLKGLLGGLAREDPYENINKICWCLWDVLFQNDITSVVFSYGGSV